MTQHETIDYAALRALIQKVQDEQADLGDLITLSHLQFDQLADLLDERERLRGAIREIKAMVASKKKMVPTQQGFNIQRLESIIDSALEAQEGDG